VRLGGSRPCQLTPYSTHRTEPGPVRVRLQRINCDAAKSYPPEGMSREWWQRLKNAFGTASSAFVQASLYQLIYGCLAAAGFPKLL
jgi:hypothetical protein